jgi:hypothetical protein
MGLVNLKSHQILSIINLRHHWGTSHYRALSPASKSSYFGMWNMLICIIEQGCSTKRE